MRQRTRRNSIHGEAESRCFHVFFFLPCGSKYFRDRKMYKGRPRLLSRGWVSKGYILRGVTVNQPPKKPGKPFARWNSWIDLPCPSRHSARRSHVRSEALPLIPASHGGKDQSAARLEERGGTLGAKAASTVQLNAGGGGAYGPRQEGWSGGRKGSASILSRGAVGSRR